MSKVAQRRELQQRLARFENYEAASHAVTTRLMMLPVWQDRMTICLYRADASLYEIELSHFTDKLKRTYRNTTLVYVDNHPHAAFPAIKPDAIVAPLVGFDTQLHRLGRGAGWYDKLFATYPDAQRIGLGFDFQQLESVVTETHDQTMNIIVTESRTLLRSLYS